MCYCENCGCEARYTVFTGNSHYYVCDNCVCHNCFGESVRSEVDYYCEECASELITQFLRRVTSMAKEKPVAMPAPEAPDALEGSDEQPE